ncbi:Cys-tRNA(Pro)/Cys-tRNA(Cys) deacylase [Spirochaetia bacterium]|nr:Cys-tRNA(Pro)/Cys-tRNA(Cys) deacylase [Spirochaetia bacterium]
MAKTNVMRLLSAAGINFAVKEYPVDESDLSAIHAAEFLDIPPEQVFKTLVLQGASGAYTVCCIPAAAGLDLKKTAKAAGEKSISLIPMKDLHPLTGYIRGGCSPIGMKKQFPTFIDETAELFDTIGISAGERGVQVVLAPAELANFIGAQFADVSQFQTK